MTNYKNDLPIYAEQIIINQEVDQIQQILNQFKQLVPEGYQKLEPAKKNNWGSTEGLDKTLCERYLFAQENNKPIWLDITRELIEKLELPFGKNCPWPFYLKSEVLEPERGITEGAITIENEEEIFLQKPFTVENLEEDIDKLFNKIKELNKWIIQFPNQQTPETVQERIDALIRENDVYKNERDNRPDITLDEWNNDYSKRPTQIQFTTLQNNYNSWINKFPNENAEQAQARISSLATHLTTTNTTLNQKNTQITNLTSQVNSLTNQLNNLQTQLNTANAELAKEKGWWGKWIKNDYRFIYISQEKIYLKSKSVGGNNGWDRELLSTGGDWNGFPIEKEMKQFIKEKIYKFWRG